MPLPEPKSNETKDEFISRFMQSDVATKEFKDQKQRVAVAFSQWVEAGHKDKKKK